MGVCDFLNAVLRSVRCAQFQFINLWNSLHIFSPLRSNATTISEGSRFVKQQESKTRKKKANGFEINEFKNFHCALRSLWKVH